MNAAFFDTKPYDRPAFEKSGARHGIDFKFFAFPLGKSLKFPLKALAKRNIL